jgi:hypothetical protein
MYLDTSKFLSKVETFFIFIDGGSLSLYLKIEGFVFLSIMLLVVIGGVDMRLCVRSLQPTMIRSGGNENGDDNNGSYYDELTDGFFQPSQPGRRKRCPLV